MILLKLPIRQNSQPCKICMAQNIFFIFMQRPGTEIKEKQDIFSLWFFREFSSPSFVRFIAQPKHRLHKRRAHKGWWTVIGVAKPIKQAHCQNSSEKIFDVFSRKSTLLIKYKSIDYKRRLYL